MSSHSQPSVLHTREPRSGGSFRVTSGPCWGQRCVLYLEGALHAPVDGDLRDRVDAFLRRGERTIVLDLSGLQSIDAAGVSELIRAHNIAAAANGALQIVHAGSRVRQMLERVELFDLLRGD